MPVVLGAFLFTNPWPLIVLAAIAAYIGAREISQMLHRDSHIAGALASLLVVGSAWVDHSASIPLCAGLFLVGVLSVALCVSEKAKWLLPFTILWVAAPLAAIVFLAKVPAGNDLFHFRVPALLAILPLWGGDTAAIFAGKAFGKHLLAPTISPKKTVEGSIANLIACVLVAWGLGPLLGATLEVSLLSGFVAGTMGQAGDLFESYVKRKAGVKDSGTLLPGHGGLMDRIDSILFTAPGVALILWAASQ
jgi:phosphatidate cytidylyltransferase